MNTSSLRAPSSWKSALVVSAVILLGFTPTGCDGLGKDSGGTRSGLFLVDVVIGGDPISVQINTTVTLTATGRYSDNSFKDEPVTWSVVGGFASIDADGHLHGDSIGLTHVMAVSISDPTVTKTALVNVTPVPPPPVTINPAKSTPPNAQIGANYSYALGSVNGTGPMTWSISAGLLPQGIALNAATGILTGAAIGPVATYNFSIQVLDSVGTSDSKATKIVVTNVVGT